jgi:hypothetical protein
MLYWLTFDAEAVTLFVERKFLKEKDFSSWFVEKSFTNYFSESMKRCVNNTILTLEMLTESRP